MSTGKTNDPWVHEDDAEAEAQATPAQGTASAPAESSEEKETAPEVQKPDVAADPQIPSLVLPKPEITPAPAESSEEKETAPEVQDEFPNDYGECLKISATLQGADKLSDRPSPAQKARAARFKRLQSHIHAIQQGSPVIHTNAHSSGAYIGIHHAGLSDTKLRILARGNREVKKLLDERDALRKENESLKAANETLVTQINALRVAR